MMNAVISARPSRSRGRLARDAALRAVLGLGLAASFPAVVAGQAEPREADPRLFAPPPVSTDTSPFAAAAEYSPVSTLSSYRRQPAEAGEPREPLFTRRDLGFAAAFVLGTAALAPVDLVIAEAVQDSVIQADAALRGGAGVFRWLGFPGVAVISGGLYVAGAATGHREAADIGLHTTEAIVAAELVTIAAKAVIGRARPRLDTGDPYDFDLLRGITHDDYQSFPSGHTTAAFAAAAALTTEISRHHPEAKWWVGTIMFGGATLMGVSRLYHNEHWASDVAAGAAVGSFGGWKIVRYMHQRPDNRIDRWLLPTAVPAQGGGVTVAWSIAPPR